LDENPTKIKFLNDIKFMENADTREEGINGRAYPVRYFEIFGPSTPTDPESVRPPY
jgi:hypothetical protein